jgi:hypothetical protein
MAFENILKGLQNKELMLPYLENQILADKWPEKYTVEVDSSPYYGAGDGFFHPSTHPLMGARELYYRFHPDHAAHNINEPNTLQRQMTLAMGSSIHAILQQQMLMMKMVRPQDIEVEYVIEEHHVRGRIDWIFNHPSEGPIPVECKTRTGYKFDSTTIEDMPSWDAQLSLGEYATGHTRGVLLMMESAWPYRLRELPHIRNDALLRDIFDKFDYVTEAIRVSEPPRHCCAFGSPQMTSCGSRMQCWMRET